MTLKSANEMASKENMTLSDTQVKTRCLTTTNEGETFLRKEGPSALIITGTEFDPNGEWLSPLPIPPQRREGESQRWLE